MGGFGDDADCEPNATPKLSLSKLPIPNKQMREAALVMPTPPSKMLASVPFQWEEAPGKPRSSSSSSSPPSTNNKKKNITNTNTNTTARRLDLPPRLVLINNYNTIDSSSSSSSSSSASSKFSATNFYSPTAVLDGPEDGRSFTQNSLRSLEEEIIREAKHHHHHLHGKRDGSMNSMREGSSMNFTSWGLGSLKESNWRPTATSASASFGFSSSASFTASRSHTWRSTSSSSKLPRFKRRSSFASLSHAGSNFLAGIYGSFKQVVQWRSRREQKKI